MIKSHKFDPAPGFMLVRPIAERDRKIGGLYLPDAAESELMRVEVVAAGNRSEDSEYDWQPGDTLLTPNRNNPHTRGSFYKITADGVEHYIMADQEVIGRLRDESSIAVVQ